MVQVYSASDPADAHLVHDMLDRAGIRAVIQGENLFGGRGGLPISPGTAPSVWVNEADFERARALIDEREARRKTSPPPPDAGGD